MHRYLKLLFASLIVVGAATPALAQTITNVTPGFGGPGPNGGGPWTITGTGFPFPYPPKSVRIVDAAGAEVLSGVDCTSSTQCTASFAQPFRLLPGNVSTIQLYAVVNTVTTASHVSFIYYGEPVVNNLAPNNGPYNAGTAYNINGAGFPSTGTGFPGVMSVYLFTSISDNASGCSTTVLCARSAPAISSDCCIPQGAKTVDIRTPGGFAAPYFIYRNAADAGGTPATPTITSISAGTGPQGGGNVVTITGTNFIPGGNPTYGGGFNVKVGSIFTFSTSGAFGTSNDATGVNCTTTTCTMVVPPGGTGPVDIRVANGCPPNSASCGGANPRPSFGIPLTKSGLYAYPGIKVTADNNSNSLYTAETGGAYTATYNVSLYSAPTGTVNVAVSVSGGSSGVLVSPNNLVFNALNWGNPQTVTIAGGINQGAGNFGYTIRNVATSADLNYNNLERDTAVTNLDSATKNFYLTPWNGLVTTRGGGTATYKLALTAAPSATVTVHLASSDPAAGTPSPSTLTFDTAPGGATGWNVPRTITVTGHNDGTPGRSRPYSIITSTVSTDTTYGNVPGAFYAPDAQVTNVDAATAPSGLSLVRTGAGVVMASWNTVANAEYYNVKYSMTAGGAKTTLAAVGMPGAAMGGLTVGQQYYFVISTMNAGGESANSSEVPFMLLPPVPSGAFDADNKAEMTYYTAAGNWKIRNSVGGFVSTTTVALGGAGYTPVMGDYDGDGREDVAVYNGATGAWNVLKSSSGFVSSMTFSWGGAGYLPEPGDYDGDGKTDPTVYKVSTGQWSVLTSSSNYTATIVANWGGGGYTPIPGQDFDGDFRADIAVYQQSTGAWLILKSSGNYLTVLSKSWGGVGYTLVPGDYDLDGKCDLGLYQRATGTWAVLLSGANYTTTVSKNWGGPGYLPIPEDFDGDGKIDLGLFEQATGNWAVLLSSVGYTTTVTASAWGTSADRPISSAIYVGGDDASRAADVDADSKADITVYNVTTGAWSTLTSASAYLSALNNSWGGSGYTAVPGDYDGDGRADRGLYQGATGTWAVLLSSTNFTTSLSKNAGGVGWIPVPGDYDADGKTDFVAYNTTTGQWFGLKSSANYTTTVSISYGGAGYAPVPGDFDGDGKTDIAVYQGSTGNWIALLSSTNYTTSVTKNVGGAGYIPVQGDYDGDGKTDLVVYNTTSGLWYGLKSSANYTTTVNVTWGGTGYQPIKGDYDGDGKTDLATYVSATGTWYVLLSATNYTTTVSKALGGGGYVAVPIYP